MTTKRPPLSGPLLQRSRAKRLPRWLLVVRISSFLQRLFPDGNDAFHFIDEELASGEGFAAMWCDYFDPERGFVRGDGTDAVNEADRFDGPALLDLIEDEIELVSSHFIEGFILDSADQFAFLRPAHDTSKVNDSPHFEGERPARNQFCFVDRAWSDDDVAFHVLLTKA